MIDPQQSGERRRALTLDWPLPRPSERPHCARPRRHGGAVRPRQRRLGVGHGGPDEAGAAQDPRDAGVDLVRTKGGRTSRPWCRTRGTVALGYRYGLGARLG